MFKIIMMHMDVHMHLHMHLHMGVHMNVVNHSCTVVRRGTVFRPSQDPSNITICICTCTWMWLIISITICICSDNLSLREFISCHADNCLKVFQFISIINRTKTSIRDGLEFKQHCGLHFEYRKLNLLPNHSVGSFWDVTYRR